MLTWEEVELSLPAYREQARISYEQELAMRQRELEALDQLTPESKRLYESKRLNLEDEHEKVTQNPFSRVPTAIDAPPVNRWMKPRSSKNKKKRIRTSPRSIAQHLFRQRQSRAQKERDASLGSNCLLSDHDMLDEEHPEIDGHTIISFERRFAEIALEFYKKGLDAKFEVVEILFSNRAMLAVPGFGLNRLCDPGNIDGCVFCRPNEIFVHPAHGCPAGGREKVKFTENIQMDASQGQIVRCSQLHPPRPSDFYADKRDQNKYFERVKSFRRGFSETALEFYEKNTGGAEFEMVEFVYEACKSLAGPGLEGVEEWCHVCFAARPRNVDSNSVSSKYFFGELLKDVTTRKFVATYCETFEPTYIREAHVCYDCDEWRGHGCAICPPCQIHPIDRVRVGSLDLPRFVFEA
ncbi:hypothetical protein M5689_010605 [Euphorbia peplus]|nr:hypothetical protein M5689_010605 [Euphorbia peplus]